ncbi:MAG: oxygenase MpaB family protein [Acidimicrobiales bacterium]
MTTQARSTSKAVGAPLGPGSLLWETAGDPRSLIPGTGAGILQLMLPSLGAAVTDHSDFFSDPYDRIFRSIPYIWGSIFAPDDVEGDRRGREIRDFHPDIKGVDAEGRRYHALDPDTYWWAHATFTWEFFRARELYFPWPLNRAQRNQMYAESVTWYRRYGVSERPVPATYDAFLARFDEICRHELELTPAVQWVLDPSANPATGAQRISLPGPFTALSGFATDRMSDLLRVTVYGNLPDVVRRRFDMRWTHQDRIAFAAVCAGFRAMDPAIRRGALSSIFPERTPHLDPRDHTRVVVAGPNPRQRARRAHSTAIATVD